MKHIMEESVFCVYIFSCFLRIQGCVVGVYGQELNSPLTPGMI